MVSQFEVMVSKVIRETPDIATLVLFTGNERLEYKAGQFVTIDPHQFPVLRRFTDYLEDVKGKKELPRAYSLASAPHEKFLAITIKDEEYVKGISRYPPLLSPLLVHQVQAGFRMIVSGFTGPYVLPDDVAERTDHIVHLAAGSGFVPNFSIIKEDLRTGSGKLRHTVLYSNRTWADICFRDELHVLERDYPERLKVTHTLTREPDPTWFSERVRKGRISLELLREHIPDPSNCLVYVCGPAISPWERRAALETKIAAEPKFLETALDLLGQLGVEKSRIKRESWG
jgi:3-ketosteroid 9alpha-monooxygenase subunit B